MIYEILAAKIHRATVTEANVNYKGSISIDKKLLDITGIKVYEKVHVWDVTNGKRLQTYVIPGKDGEITMNGAAAKLIKKGHKIIITCFRFMDEKEVKTNRPKIVIVDEKNKVKEMI